MLCCAVFGVTDGEQSLAKFRAALATKTSDITSPFRVSLDLFRAGLNPTCVKSNVTAMNLSSVIGAELAERSWSILAQLIRLVTEMRTLVFNFWNTVEHSVSSHEAMAILESTCDQVVASQRQRSTKTTTRMAESYTESPPKLLSALSSDEVNASESGTHAYIYLYMHTCYVFVINQSTANVCVCSYC